MPEDSITTKVLDRFQQLQTDRRAYEQNWQSIRDLVRPGTTDFNRQVTPGQLRTLDIFDGTAPKANGELASALIGYLLSPVMRWFDVEVRGMTQDEMSEQLDDAALLWLEQVADAIYDQYKSDSTNFNNTMRECMLDIGAFGTCVPSQEWSEDGLCFKSHALASCYLQEDSDGMIDTVMRELKYTTRQVLQEFSGDVIPKKIMEERQMDKPWKILHSVFPRSDRNFFKRNVTNKKFASLWISVDCKESMRESGYDALPYHPARWVKLAEEIYGRGPAIDCLPDIRMLNQMEKTLLKSGQKVVDPPLQVPDDGFLLPIKTFPGALIFKDPSAPNIEPLITKANLPFGLEQANQKRDFIKTCFYIDWIRMEKENKEMTAYEVSDRRDEKLRLLSPMFGRLMTELLGPMIARSYNLLNEHGRLPQAPPSLQGKRLKVEYTSPAAKAQKMVKAMDMDRYIQGMIPMAQLSPDIMDIVDLDAYARERALLMGTTRLIIRSKQQVADIRAQKQQAQQTQGLMQMAEPATKAIKNLADAKDKGGGIDLSALQGQ